MQKQVALITRLAGQDDADLAEHVISFFHTKPRPMWNIRSKTILLGKSGQGSHGELRGHDGRCSI